MVKCFRSRSPGVSSYEYQPPADVGASRALREQFIAHRFAALDSYQRHQDDIDTAWQEAAWVGEDIGYLDPEELVEATERITAVIGEYTAATRPRSAHARRVAFFGYAVPTDDDPS